MEEEAKTLKTQETLKILEIIEIQEHLRSLEEALRKDRQLRIEKKDSKQNEKRR